MSRHHSTSALLVLRDSAMTTVTTRNPDQRNTRPTVTPATRGRVDAPVTPNSVARSQFIEPERRHAMICDAAYFLWERRGFRPGHELDDWLAAEGEIDRQLTSRDPANGCGG
jgi:Protein of unknown function (DUF2934)